MTAEYARRAVIKLIIAGVDVSRDISEYLENFTYDDAKSGEADSVSVELNDRSGIFIGDWFPKKNSTLEAAIQLRDWDKQNDNKELKCGTFEIDEIEARQGAMTIKAVSVPVTSGGRREKISKTWEKTKLKTVAADIAKKSGLSLNYTAIENPYYGRIDQKQESSLEFLVRIVHKAGLAMKVADKRICIYNELDAEKEDASFVIDRTGGHVKDWSFRTQSVETYKSCEVSYFDAKKKETYRGFAGEAGETPSGQILKITNERVESNAEAAVLAQKMLRDSNKREVTGSLTLVGDLRIMDGVVIQVAGFGSFNGKYRIASSSHSVGNGGYTTTCELESGPPSVRGGGKGEKKANKKANKKKEDAAKYWRQ